MLIVLELKYTVRAGIFLKISLSLNLMSNTSIACPRAPGSVNRD